MRLKLQPLWRRDFSLCPPAHVVRRFAYDAIMGNRHGRVKAVFGIAGIRLLQHVRLSQYPAALIARK
jgi:hypothetical protein